MARAIATSGRMRSATAPVHALYAALVFLPVVVTLHTWVYFLGLAPAGSGLTGCLLEEYCHTTPADVIHSQILGIGYVLLPLLVLGLLAAARLPGIQAAAVGLCLGTARFALPLVIWLVGLHVAGPVPLRALVSYCATESTCQVQPGYAYYFITPLELLSGTVSLVLYVLTITVWLHLQEGR